jgi:hypothetical protein
VRLPGEPALGKTIRYFLFRAYVPHIFGQEPKNWASVAGSSVRSHSRLYQTVCSPSLEAARLTTCNRQSASRLLEGEASEKAKAADGFACHPLMQDAGLVGQFRPPVGHIEEASPEVGLGYIGR